MTKETKLTLLYIFIALAFSMAARMIWYYDFLDNTQFFYNGQFMINTNDGYYFAEGARDVLAGFHQEGDASPIDNAMSLLTALFAKLLPFSFESVILFMPLVLSSLIVIPIVLIGKRIGSLETGFIAALLASIAWSYYNRTMIGYYDTDMLNIVLPMLLLWSVVWAFETNEDKYLLITALDILAYRWWYPQSYSLEFAFFGLILLYTLIFERKKLYNYKLLAIMMFAMVGLHGLIRLPLVIAVYLAFKHPLAQKYVYHTLAASVVLFFASGGFSPIWDQLKGYVFRDSISVADEGMGLHFFSVMQTVREAGSIDFITFANRISGHVVTFFISIIGYGYLVYRHKVMIFALPLIGLGFLASVGGLRFTIYAVAPFALGIAFLIAELSQAMPTKKLKFLSASLLTLLILLPNLFHIKEYQVPTVFNADEVAVLEKLHSTASRNAYVAAWWDYGYPLRYYSDVKTLIDGGKHGGSDNFTVSYMLTNPSDVAAKMARLDVEYTQKGIALAKKIKEGTEKNVTIFSNIEQMSKDYGFSDTNDFLLALQTDIKLPKPTTDVYLYLPMRMLEIFPTVERFSALDLMNGDTKNPSLFFVSRNFSQKENIVSLGDGVSIDLKDKVVVKGSEKIAIKNFAQVAYTKDMQLKKQIDTLDGQGRLNVIYMSSFNTFLILDEKAYGSSYIQMLILEEYDKGLWEEVILTPHTKVFKLKI